jgi:hypothetical protein
LLVPYRWVYRLRSAKSSAHWAAISRAATLFTDAKFEIAPAKHKTGTALPWASLISSRSETARGPIFHNAPFGEIS